MTSRYEHDVYAMAKSLGATVAKARNSLSDLAIASAEAAAKGRLDEDDAQGIYEEYIKACEPEHEPTEGSLKGNVSKLRQIIKAAAAGPEIMTLFERVRTTHEKLKKTTRTVPLYSAYVDAARIQAQRGVPPSDAQIEKICRWRWG